MVRGDVFGEEAQGLAVQFQELERILGSAHGDADLGGSAPPGATDDTAATLAVVAYPLYPTPGVAEAPVEYRPTEPFPAASTIKVFVLQALMERVAAGNADLDDELVVADSDLVSGSGVLKALTPGRRYTLRDLATLMIVVSDNSATNVLLDYVGVEQVNASAAAHGWTGTVSAGKLQTSSSSDQPTRRRRSLTTARDLADCFARLWRGELLPPSLTAECQAIYRKQQYCELGRYLEYDNYLASIGEGSWRIASKSGSITGVRNDAGVFEPLTGNPHGEPYVVAVMTKGCPDERFHAENLGARVVGRASAAVFGRFGN